MHQSFLNGCSLTLILAVWVSATIADERSVAARSQQLLSVLDDSKAWQRLPKVDGEIIDRRLPVWARMLVRPLPRTTAAMLELDYIYRTSRVFDARLRAKMRWVAARANRCLYSQRYAEADLVRAGLTRDEVAELETNLLLLPPQEKAAITFAYKLTLAADSVTDDEVAELITAFGEPSVVAMVLQIAYANFQDRLLLTLQADVEPDGPLPPIEVRFAAAAADESIAAERPKPPMNSSATLPVVTLGKDWTSVAFDQLLLGMEQQKERKGRVTIPKWADVFPRLPAGLYSAEKPLRIKWSLVVLGHEPQMGSAWMKCMRTFGREANQDRVFEESLFWVITRAIDCFY